MIARERIEILLDQAKTMARTNEQLSRRYVQLARRISERTKVRIPTDLKRYLCKNCGLALVPGYNARVRLYAHKSGIVVTCLSCGKAKRYPTRRRIMTEKPTIAMKPYMSQSSPYPRKNPTES